MRSYVRGLSWSSHTISIVRPRMKHTSQRICPRSLTLPRPTQEEKEVTAAAVLLRSTLFGWCFLDYWAASHGRIAGNGDNGVLLQVHTCLLPRGASLTSAFTRASLAVALSLVSHGTLP